VAVAAVHPAVAFSAHRHAFGTWGSAFSQVREMLQLQESAITIFAVVITTPKSLLPAEITIGLSVVSAITVAIALVAALRRDKGLVKTPRDKA
jgi:hypothetical protein